MTKIHPTAVVDSAAQLSADVTVGPYCVIGPNVSIGAGTELKSHISIDGHTRIGERCIIFPFASLGAQTQDLKFAGGAPAVEIGDQTTIRENVTVNAATADGDVTRVGSRCHIMAYAHVAHDCIVGDDVIMANCATLAGHVVVEDQAILGGLCGVHQFVRIGRASMTGGLSKIIQDIPRFSLTDGHPLAVRGINLVGLQRRGADADTIRDLKQCHRIFYRQNLGLKAAVEKAEEQNFASQHAKDYIAFMKSSERGVTR